MKFWLVFGLAISLVGGRGFAADYATLRNLQAPPPVVLEPLAPGAKPRAVKFSRIVIHPRDGEAWAIAYASLPFRAEDDPRPSYSFLTWQSGRIEGDTESFARIFDEQLAKAGFQTAGGESLFADQDNASDFQVAVMVDDIKGRFCNDCPNLLNRSGIPATVLMNAHWEIYSNLERKVVAKIVTNGGGDSMVKLQGSVLPGVLAGFRENVRMLLASPDFRAVVTGPAAQPAVALDPIAFRTAPVAKRPLSSAVTAVAAVLTGDGFGTGFLISADGYVLTNHHVVGAARFVKVRWSDKTETTGEVLRSDARRDIALIKVSAGGRKPLSLRTAGVSLGETVFAIGTPLEEQLQSTITKGIVSGARTRDGLAFIQSDVAINHGNSGGPLIDENGAVLGVADLFLGVDGKPVGLNFFIPIDEALKALALRPAG